MFQATAMVKWLLYMAWPWDTNINENVQPLVGSMYKIFHTKNAILK